MSNMVIQTNVLSLNSHRNAKLVGNTQAKSSARLSSGYKINSAADDAAGLAISEKMRAQIRGLDMASKNSQDAISLVQTAEGGMQEIDNMLQRIRELTVQVSNDTNEHNSIGTGDRKKVQDEIDQLTSEIDSMAERIEFNKKKVINGSFADPLEFLKNASTKYAVAQTNLNSANNGLTDALAKQTQAYDDFKSVSDAVEAFESGKRLLETAKTNAIKALEGSNISTYAGVTSLNASVLEKATKDFRDELSKLDPKLWTESEINTLANKYFDSSKNKDLILANPTVPPSGTEFKSTNAVVTLSNGGAWSIRLTGEMQDSTASTGTDINILTHGGSDLGTRMNAAYVASQNLKAFDSNVDTAARNTLIGTLNANVGALQGATVNGGTYATAKQAAVNAAVQAFRDELITYAPDKWDQALLQEIANKHFTDASGATLGSGAATAGDLAKEISATVTLTGTTFSIVLNGKDDGGGASTAINIAGATGGNFQTQLNAVMTALAAVKTFDAANPEAVRFVGANKSGGFLAPGVTATIPPTTYAHSSNQGLKLQNNVRNSADLYDLFNKVTQTKNLADVDVVQAQKSVDRYQEQINRYGEQITSSKDQINTLNGNTPGLYFQVGANSNQSIQLSISSVKTDFLGIGDGNGKSKLNVLTDTGADITNFLDVLDESLSYVTTERSKLGAVQNRLEYAIKSLDISSENLSASESRIRDTDMAKEMMNLTKSNVLQQAATAMLAQANQAPQAVLQLLR